MSRAAEFCKIAVDDDGRLSALICRKLNMRLPAERIAGSLGFLLGGKLAGGVLFSDLRPGCDVWISIYADDKAIQDARQSPSPAARSRMLKQRDMAKGGEKE